MDTELKNLRAIFAVKIEPRLQCVVSRNRLPIATSEERVDTDNYSPLVSAVAPVIGMPSSHEAYLLIARPLTQRFVMYCDLQRKVWRVVGHLISHKSAFA